MHFRQCRRWERCHPIRTLITPHSARASLSRTPAQVEVAGVEEGSLPANLPDLLLPTGNGRVGVSAHFVENGVGNGFEIKLFDQVQELVLNKWFSRH